MDILPTILLVLFVVFLIAIILVLRRLRSQEPSAQPMDVGAEGGETQSQGATVAKSAAQGDGLETMRLAVEQMDTDHIENLLEMGATLKPGAEDVFREELERRRKAAEQEAED